MGWSGCALRAGALTLRGGRLLTCFFDDADISGMLMFEALNNAQALPEPGVGCSAGGGALVMFPLLIAGVLLMAMRRERIRN